MKFTANFLQSIIGLNMTKILSRKASGTIKTYVNFADVSLLQFWKIEKSFGLLKLIVVFLVQYL